MPCFAEPNKSKFAVRGGGNRKLFEQVEVGTNSEQPVAINVVWGLAMRARAMIGRDKRIWVKFDTQISILLDRVPI